MDCILIVEDEKLIRQGIHAMISRSGVPVGEILEAPNGERALEILRERRVDVMLTDIRMPRMDGIELVRHTRELPHVPVIVAVSGYDDFTYAVEMLRNGVFEYLLKPVKRDKLKEVLVKIQEKQEREREAVRAQEYSSLLARMPYVLLMLPETGEEKELAIENAIPLEDVREGNVFLMAEEKLPDFLARGQECRGCGVSGVHRGREELKSAYAEVESARQEAFCRGELVRFGEDWGSGETGQAAEELLSVAARTQRLQLIGTKRKRELVAEWEKVFSEVSSGGMDFARFRQLMREQLEETVKVYRSVISKELREGFAAAENVLAFSDIRVYGDYVKELLLEAQGQAGDEETDEPMRRKMELALEYVRENYSKDLNMAVVSNYISMNYSVFSFEFKRYTGQNFVTYLKEIRIRQALRLLEETDDKVVDISHRVGYGNEKNFLKVFKNEFGVSPSEYRRNMRR